MLPSGDRSSYHPDPLTTDADPPPLDVILNALLIPHFGILGAAVATLTTYIVIHIVMPLMIRATRKAGTLILQGMMFQGVLDDEMKQLIRKAFQKAIRKIKRK